MGMKERAREEWKLQEVGGQRGMGYGDYAREREETLHGGTKRREEKRTGAVFTKGHVARALPFFNRRDFSIFPIPPCSTFRQGFSRILFAAGNRRGDDPLNRIRLMYSDSLPWKTFWFRVVEELAVSAIYSLAARFADE